MAQHQRHWKVNHDGWEPSSQFANLAPTGLDCVEEADYGGLEQLASALHGRGKLENRGEVHVKSPFWKRR